MSHGHYPQTEQGCLDVFVQAQHCGVLGRSAVKEHAFVFGYKAKTSARHAVSLTMPVVPDQYNFQQGIHPIFQMNLPEGALRKALYERFHKTLPHFDDLALLSIVGHSQIGDIRSAFVGHVPGTMPLCDIHELRTHHGGNGIFADLLRRYASYSGVSGMQPKVLVRDSKTVAAAAGKQLEQFCYRNATHLVKAWNAANFPQLAANEYFCMVAANEAGLFTADVELAAQGRLLLVKRFDLDGEGGYLGFEDFCVLNGLATEDKYLGSYQDIVQRIRQFVSPLHLHDALEQFFLSLAFSCAVRNGDAHLKNFGVLYDHPEGEVRLAPAFDIVSTTPYCLNDKLALFLGDSKEFPTRKRLLTFARQFCGINERRAKRLLEAVVDGLEKTLPRLKAYQVSHPEFQTLGEQIQIIWQQSINEFLGKN